MLQTALLSPFSTLGRCMHVTYFPATIQHTIKHRLAVAFKLPIFCYVIKGDKGTSSSIPACGEKKKIAWKQAGLGVCVCEWILSQGDKLSLFLGVSLVVTNRIS